MFHCKINSTYNKESDLNLIIAETCFVYLTFNANIFQCNVQHQSIKISKTMKLFIKNYAIQYY